MQSHSEKPKKKNKKKAPSILKDLEYLLYSHANFSKIQNVISQSLEIRILICEVTKLAGNSHFTTGNYEKAKKKYLHCITFFRYYCPETKSIVTETQLRSSPEFEKIVKILTSIFLNLAATHLQMSSFQDAYHSACEALLLEPQNPKAFYRKAKSLLGMNGISQTQLKEAAECLEMAAKFSPGETAILNELAKVKTLLGENEQKKDGFNPRFIFG